MDLFGAFVLYQQVRANGCDPSAAVTTNEPCSVSAANVFGVLLGIIWGALAFSQVANFSETLGDAQVAVYEALLSINRTVGAPEQVIYKKVGLKPETSRADIEVGKREHEIKAILPKYEIDSSSTEGAEIEIKGAISIKDVNFSYPTRPGATVLQRLSLDIAAGSTVALVGPSGGGKSTVVSLLERFYDPQVGSISLDGHDLKDINLPFLRRNLGYVGQVCSWL